LSNDTLVSPLTVRIEARPVPPWVKCPLLVRSRHLGLNHQVAIGPSFVTVKSSKKPVCELRKRIVARPHDHDTIARTSQPDQHVATGAAVWKSKGLSARPLDFANKIFAPNAAVDRAPEINGLGHDENIFIAQPACEAVH